ncbi:MAG: hypothetical protein NC921_00840 [Candidatus Omnitrophica bacterium]|nr:hypothetical protein [Candidatus Omnitrophota bacterium]
MRFKNKIKVQVVDVRNVPWKDTLFFTSLQGIVNKKEPKLYLLFNDYDIKWLKYYKKFLSLSYEKIYKIDVLLNTFRNYLKGYVVWDPEIPDTANIATTLSGLNNWLIIHPEKEIFVEKFGLKKYEDLRGKFKGKSKTEIYKLTFEEFKDKLNKNAVACLEVPPANLINNFDYFPCQNHIRDLIISEKIFSFDLTSNPEYKEEFELKEEIFKSIKKLGLVLGWRTLRGSEALHVKQASRNGLIVVCCLNSPNLSFHRHIRPNKILKLRTPIIKKKLENKIYISFIISDGDAFHWDLSFQSKQWFSKNRGEIPLGWELQLLLLDYAPSIWNYYLETSTENDEILAAASGIGYIFPTEMPEQFLSKYLSYTKKYMEKVNLRNLVILPGYKPLNENIIKKYKKLCFKKSLLCLQEGYGKWEGPGFVYKNLICLKTRLGGGNYKKEDLIEDLEKISKCKKRPLFITTHLVSITYDEVIKIMKNFTEFEIVPPSILFRLAYKYFFQKKKIIGKFKTGEE